jgi:hypothetical protein
MTTTTPTITKAWSEVADAVTDFRVTFVSRAPKCEYAMEEGVGDPTVAGRKVRFPDLLKRDVCGAGRLMMRIEPESTFVECTLHVSGA